MKNTMNEFPAGTYGYDLAFFDRQGIKTIELTNAVSKARVLIVPDYQGRVMTSSASGKEGMSFGWINYKLITSGKVNPQFNPYGGEERFWLGPEGGPFSIYFKPGVEQVYANWVVPKQIDTEPFALVASSHDKVRFSNEFTLTNASNTEMKIGVVRTIRLLAPSETEELLQYSSESPLASVAYESENVLINKGNKAWNAETGVLSIWLLSMFNPSEKGTVFIPIIQGDEKELGKLVSDDYFGKVPSDRLREKDGIIFFKTDGKYRSKIGISPQRALPFCGSYDPVNSVLTLLWYSAPDVPSRYVNSKWGDQDDPLKGDVVNSYNDGPVEDGSIMGPFYEIESSSPAAFLNPGDSIVHKQRIFHITGDNKTLNTIVQQVFNITLEEIEQAFSQ